MKVKITEDAKRIITAAEMPMVKQLVKEMNEMTDDGFASDLNILKNIFEANRVIEASAEIAKNGRIWQQYGENSQNFDVWVTALIYKSYPSTYYEVGAYLSDIWQAAGDNREELKSHMYIREHRIVE